MSLGGGEVDGGAAVVVTHIEIDVLDVRIKVIPIKNNSYILIDLTCSHDLCRALMSPEHAARSIWMTVWEAVSYLRKVGSTFLSVGSPIPSNLKDKKMVAKCVQYMYTYWKFVVAPMKIILTTNIYALSHLLPVKGVQFDEGLAELDSPDWISLVVQRRRPQGDAHHIGDNDHQTAAATWLGRQADLWRKK